MDDDHHSDRDRQGHTEERESPMFVPQDNEDGLPGASERPERATSSPGIQNSARRMCPDIKPNEVVDLSFLNEANNAGDQENAPEVDDGDQEEEQVEEEAGGKQGNNRSGERGKEPGEEPGEEDCEEEHNDQDATDKDGPDRRPAGGQCSDECKRWTKLMKKRLARKDGSIKTKNDTIKTLKETIRRYEIQLRANGLIPEGKPGRAQVRPKRDGGGRSSAPTWPDMLRHSIASGMEYEKAWKQSQRELNMPVDRETIHPNIRFITRDADRSLDGNSRQSSPVIPETRLPGQKPLRISFDGLPREALFRILQEILWFDGSLIHCFSRLDPYIAPDHFPSVQELGDKRTGIRGRFFISAEKRVPLSLTHDTVDPNTILAPLSVCRRWAWYGSHIFYGRNTFALSSLGEWERFCNGIKKARVQRLQNVELTWIGGKCLSFDTSETGGKRMNMRTMSLTWFCETRSLKTLVIHITETSRNYIRRRYEPLSSKLYMKGKTAGQPNARLTRALRCCHGMDYIYQLRGLHWLHVYDMDKTVLTMERHPVRDSSFVIDLQRVVTQEKVPSRAKKSSLSKLKRLLPKGGWMPVPFDFKLIRQIFSEDTGYDPRENDLDNDTTSSKGTLSPSPPPKGSDDEAPDDSSNGSGSDDEAPDDSSRGSGSISPGPGLPTPPASTGRQMRRCATPAPTRVEILDSDEDNVHQSEGDDEEEEGEEESDQDIEDDQELDHNDGDVSEQGSGCETDESDSDDAKSISTDIVRTRRCHQYVRQHHAWKPADDEDAD